eukprot:EG_transcript_1733
MTQLKNEEKRADLLAQFKKAWQDFLRSLQIFYPLFSPGMQNKFTEFARTRKELFNFWTPRAIFDPRNIKTMDRSWQKCVFLGPKVLILHLSTVHALVSTFQLEDDDGLKAQKEMTIEALKKE